MAKLISYRLKTLSYNSEKKMFLLNTIVSMEYTEYIIQC